MNYVNFFKYNELNLKSN